MRYLIGSELIFICIWCEVRTQHPSLTSGYQVVPAWIIKAIITFPLNDLRPIMESWFTLNTWVYLWALNSIFNPYVYSYANTILSWLMLLCSKFWTEKWDSSYFDPSPRFFFSSSILVSWISAYTLKSALQFLPRSQLRF